MSGLVRDLNPGPLAPEARIILLDQRAVESSFLYSAAVHDNIHLLLYGWRDFWSLNRDLQHLSIVNAKINQNQLTLTAGSCYELCAIPWRRFHLPIHEYLF